MLALKGGRKGMATTEEPEGELPLRPNTVEPEESHQNGDGGKAPALTAGGDEAGEEGETCSVPEYPVPLICEDELEDSDEVRFIQRIITHNLRGKTRSGK